MRVAHNSKFKTQNSKLKKKPLLFSRTEAAETKKILYRIMAKSHILACKGTIIFFVLQQNTQIYTKTQLTIFCFLLRNPLFILFFPTPILVGRFLRCKTVFSPSLLYI